MTYVYTYTFVRIENTSFHWLYIGFTVCAFAQIIFGHLGRWFPSCSRSPAGPVGVPSEMTEKNISIGFNWNKLNKEISLYWQVYIPIRLVSRSDRSDYVLFHILFHSPEPLSPIQSSCHANADAATMLHKCLSVWGWTDTGASCIADRDSHAPAVGSAVG